MWRRRARMLAAPQRVLAPGSWVLRRVPVWGKVGLVAAVLAGPLAFSLNLATSNAREAETSTRMELSALPAVVAVNELALELGRCSGARLTGRGEWDIRPALGSVTQALGQAEVTADTRAEWSDLRARLQAAQSTYGTTCRPAHSLHAELLALVDLANEIGDDARLSLDTGQRTYYTQMALTVYLPRLITGTAELMRLVGANAPSDRLQQEEVQRAGFSARNAAERLRATLDRATRDDVTVDDRAVLAEADELVGLTGAQAAAVRGLGVRTGVGRADSEAVLAGADRLVTTLAAQLRVLLEERVGEQRERWMRPALLSLASILLVIYLMVALGWSMSRDLADVRSGLADAVLGRVRAPQTAGRDELASVSRAVGEAQRQIAALLAELRRSAARHEALVSESSDVTVVTDATGRLSYVSPSLVHLLGFVPEAWRGGVLYDKAVEEDRGAVEAAVQELAGGGTTGEVRARFRHADGRVRIVAARFRDARGDTTVDGLVWNLRDITEEQALADQLHHRAFHDELTGLANRALFLDRLQQALDRSARTGAGIAVCVLDLDSFKPVNDDHGHLVGDDLLRTVAERFRAAMRPGDTVARLGGDEFGVLLEDVLPDRAQAVAARFVDSLRRPVLALGQALTVSVSGGVAVASGGGPTADQLMHEADMAMYHVKTRGGGRLVAFEPEMLRTDPRSVGLEVLDLLADPAGIAVEHQPICSLADGRVVGFEALARFPGREHRGVSEWFQLARDSGCGPALEAAALRAAFAQDERPPGTYLSLNASPSTLLSPEVQAVLDRDLRDVVIEVTEDARIDADLLDAAVSPLRRRGARIAVDDTGSGYANLQQLVRLRPDVVKLDRELVASIDAHPEKRALVEALVSFCHRTGATLCAEGIERVEELVTLVDLGVDVGQGWFLARPGTGYPPITEAAEQALGVAVPGLDLAPVLGRLAAALDEVDLARAIAGVLPALEADDVDFSVVWGRDSVLVPREGWGQSNSVYVLDDYPATSHALQSGDMVAIRVDDPAADVAEVRLLRETGYGALLIVPLVSGGEPLGFFEVYCRAERSWSVHHAAVARQVAGAATEALRRIVMRRAAEPAGVPAQAVVAPAGVGGPAREAAVSHT